MLLDHQGAQPPLRVTVAGSSRRADLVVPGGQPVADLLPDLMALVGDVERDTGATQLLTVTGQVLAEGLGLQAQGIVDGAVLQLTQTRPRPVIVYDDLVEAVDDLMAPDSSAHDSSAWAPASAAVLLALAAACLTLVGPRTPSAIGVGGIGVLLLAMGFLAVPTHVWPALPGWTASGCGAACAVLLLPAGADLATHVAMAGLGGLVPAVLDFLTRGSAHTPMLPVAVVAAATALVGAGLSVTGATPADVLVPMLIVAALGVLGLPALALRASSIHPSPIGPETAHQPVDLVELASTLELADTLVRRLYAAVGVGLVLMAPTLASAGAGGAALLLAVALLVLLRSDVHRSVPLARAALKAGLAGTLAVVASAVWAQPGWRGALAAGLLVAGVATWATFGLARPGAAARARILDVVEAVLLASLLPLATLGSGLFDSIRG